MNVDTKEEIYLSRYLLILGNGFDLDLGLNTRYSDFFQSEFWPTRGNSRLEERLIEIADSNPEWFDIETILKEYAVSEDASPYYVKADKVFF